MHQDPTRISALRLSAGTSFDAATIPLKNKIERLRHELDLAKQWKENNPNVKAVDQSESMTLLSPSHSIAESLAALVSGAAHQLQEIWDELGYNPEERESQLSDLLDEFRDLCDSKVAKERGVAETFRQTIAETKDELRTTSKALKTPVDPDLLRNDSGLTLTDELERLERALEGIRNAETEAQEDLRGWRDTINGHHESLYGAEETLAQENEFQLEGAVESPPLPDAPILTRPTFPKANASSASKADLINRLKIELDLARQFFAGATAESTIALGTDLNGAVGNPAVARQASSLNGLEMKMPSKALIENDKLVTELADQSIGNITESVVAAPVVMHSVKQNVPLELAETASSTLEALDIFQPVTQKSIDAPPVPLKTKIVRLKTELERAQQWMAANAPIKPAPPPYQREQPETEQDALTDVQVASEEVMLDDRISMPTAEAESANSASLRTKIERLKAELKLAERWMVASTPIKPAPPPYQNQQLEVEPIVATDVEATTEESMPDGLISIAEAESAKSASLRIKIERLKAELKLAEQWMAASTPIKPAPPPYQNQQLEVEPIVATDVEATTEESMPDGLISIAEAEPAKSVSLRTKIERLKAELKLAEQWMAASTPIKPAPPPYQRPTAGSRTDRSD